MTMNAPHCTQEIYHYSFLCSLIIGQPHPKIMAASIRHEKLKGKLGEEQLHQKQVHVVHVFVADNDSHKAIKPERRI